MEPDNGKLGFFQSEQHRLAFFGATAERLARPLRRMFADGTLGPEVPRFRRQQDEYLEWHATHDADGRLLALTFTAEPPDYWSALARVAPEVVLEKYHELVGPAVAPEDLFHRTDLAVFGTDLDGTDRWFQLPWKGRYDELNRWTTIDGIVHLTHRANTLGAEVFLAADASHPLASDLEPPPSPGSGSPDAEIRRIACGRYGGINRSSDPLIGLKVGDAVLGGSRVTLTEPIGLYIGTTGVSGLTGPNGEPVGTSALKIVRGEDDGFEPRILRFEVRLPPGLPFGLDECKLDGRKLARGGQVARGTTMLLYAQTYPGTAEKEAQSCQGEVCRHPVRHELFTITEPPRPCPSELNLAWLLQTPLLPTDESPVLLDFALQEIAAPAAEDPQIRVEASLDVAIELSTSRAPGHL